MKLPFLLAAIAIVAIGCTTTPEPHNSSNTSSSAVPTVQGNRAILQQPAKTYLAGEWFEREQGISRPEFPRKAKVHHFFQIDGRPIDTLQELKEFIASLPPGSTIKWDSGCIVYSVVPLKDSDLTIDAFTDYCKEHGIKFQYIISGY
jgi:hypothetical protein